MTEVHDFKKSLKWSHSQEGQPFWDEIYAKSFPTMVHSYSVRDDGWAQRGGIDRLILLADGSIIKVDEKLRSEKYPDILIEHWSDEKRKVPGWGHRDKQLTCDYIAYAIIPTRTCYMLPYQLLRRVIKLYGQSWWRKGLRKEDGHRLVRADNGSYHTLSYVVPTDVLLDALRNCFVVTWQCTDQIDRSDEYKQWIGEDS